MVVTWTSALAGLADRHYAAVLGAVARRSGVELCWSGGRWQRRLARLVDGSIDAGFLCTGLIATTASHLVPLVAPVYPGDRRPLYRSYLVTREAVDGLPALRGARWCYNEVGSLSGYHSMRLMTASLGTTPEEHFSQVFEVGSHVRAMHAVAEGRADVAAIDTFVWWLHRRAGGAANRLSISGELGPWPSQPFALQAYIPEDIRQRLSDAFLSLSPAVLAPLGIERFEVVHRPDFEALGLDIKALDGVAIH